ncbi:TPA: hypothetical protein R1706_001565, partial [Campylobacter lari]|nr:hypothetical protein [Campylobacter lari]
VRIFNPIFIYPSFKDQEKTIDYKTPFNIKVSGLLADSSVKVLKNDQIGFKESSFIVDSNGIADLKFDGIKDFKVKDFSITIEYLKQGVEKDTRTSDKINLYDYKVDLSFSKDKIHAYESENIKALKDPKPDHVEVTLKGGKPNEKITWNIKGDASLSNQEAVFNANGEAKATITSKDPFKANPIISVNTMGKDLSKELPYDLKTYTPKIT